MQAILVPVDMVTLFFYARVWHNASKKRKPLWMLDAGGGLTRADKKPYLAVTNSQVYRSISTNTSPLLYFLTNVHYNFKKRSYSCVM